MATEPVTTSSLREKKADGVKIVALTAWDYVTAELAEKAGVDITLVGDSLAMTVRGDADTLSITLEDMIYHTKMVARASRRAMVIGDMPFMSYQVCAEQALTNAGRFLKDGGARGVKIEGGRHMAGTIGKITRAGIPVMGHIGLTPQSIHQFGGFKVQGKTLEPAKNLVDDARAIEAAGAFSIVLECLPAELARYISATVRVPTIGIGAGEGCDGQIQVTADLIGLTKGFAPKHAKKYVDVNRTVSAAMRKYLRDVRDGTFPAKENSFSAHSDLLRALENKEL